MNMFEQLHSFAKDGVAKVIIDSDLFDKITKEIESACPRTGGPVSAQVGNEDVVFWFNDNLMLKMVRAKA